MPCRRAEAGPREWIDRGRTLRFTFEGRSYEGHPGDTITSALLANGVSLLGRSFKYHRPRGAFSLANHDVNALFCTPQDTHIRGDVTPLVEGMDVRPVNVRGGLDNDRDRHLDRLGRFMPVGFYYKAFHRPKALFPYWERAIRKRAGLGQVDLDWTPDRRAKRHAHCDALVVGAGPTGLTAALDLADNGCSVVLVDENPHPGASFDYAHAGDETAVAHRDALIAAVHAHPAITLHTRAVALGHYADHLVPIATPDGIIKVRARGVLLATGVIEQPAVFHNNDRPGVMLASGAQRLLHRFGVAACRRAIMVVANGEGYAAALDLHAAGIEIAAIADMGTPESQIPAARLLAAGIPVHRDHAIHAAHGESAVEAATLAPVDANGHCDLARAHRVPCDGIFMSVGWAPAGQLLYQAGGRLRYDDTLAMPVPETWPDTVVPAGRLNGVFDLDRQYEDARDAAARLRAALAGEPVPAVADHRDRVSHGAAWPIVAHDRGRNFVDLDEDIQLKDLEQAAREGFDNIELLKRFSTVGMGPSQGKHANQNAIRILARIRDQGIDATGTTTARPMFHPVRLEDLAGRRLRPTRRSPLHDAHAELGARFMDAGAWLRPAWYGAAGERAEAIAAEVRAVREAVGLIDVSTLGKIEVVGPDAARLLEAAYTVRAADLSVGAGRYALMVDESGVVVDDGLIARLGPEHFFVTASSGHAAATRRELTREAALGAFDAWVVDRTSQLGSITIAGPRSRELLAPLTDVDLDRKAFKGGIRTGHVCGQPARVLRAAFVDRIGFEVHADVAATRLIWGRLMDDGAALGVRAFGVEAQRVLRLEMGHIIVGQDTDGLTDPFEAAMAGAVHFDKPAFIGRGALALLAERTRRRLVAFTLPADADTPLPRESHLVIEDGEIAGRVTSIAHSATLGHAIGFAMVDTALADSERALTLRVDDGVLVRATRAATPFVARRGKRAQPESRS